MAHITISDINTENKKLLIELTAEKAATVNGGDDWWRKPPSPPPSPINSIKFPSSTGVFDDTLKLR